MKLGTLAIIYLYFEKSYGFRLRKAYSSFVCNISFRLAPRQFNSYGSRRGNDAVMARGTFANIRLVNKFMGKAGPKTIHFPSNQGVRLISLRQSSEWLALAYCLLALLETTMCNI